MTDDGPSVAEKKTATSNQANRDDGTIDCSIICYAVFTSALWAFVGTLDPFGIVTSADSYSEAVFDRLFGSSFYSTTAQDEITVVLIDDQYVEMVEQEAWPLSYIQQDLLLNNILDFKPKAIFLDLLFRHKHSEGLKQFVESINDAVDRGTPIFLPQLIEDRPDIKSCESEQPDTIGDPARLIVKGSVLQPFRESKATISYIGWTGCGNRYPAFLLGDPSLTTPSFSLFSRLCNSTNQFPGCDAIREENWSAFKYPMALRWGSRISRNHAELEAYGGQQCSNVLSDERKTKLSIVGESIAKALWSFELFWGGGSMKNLPSCSHNDTVRASWFLDARPEVRAHLKQMIEGRIILVGTKVEGVHDYVSSPVNGQLPGVYFLAMALDNYLVYGNDYVKDPSWLAELVLNFIILTIMLSVIGYAWNCVYYRKKKPVDYIVRKWEPYPFKHLLQFSLLVLIYKILIPLMLALFVAVIMWSIKVAPVSWIGLALIGFFSSPVSLRKCWDPRPLEYLDDDWFIQPCRYLSSRTGNPPFLSCKFVVRDDR